jgi:hypothetical protein
MTQNVLFTFRRQTFKSNRLLSIYIYIYILQSLHSCCYLVEFARTFYKAWERHGAAVMVHGNTLTGGEKGVVIYGWSSMAEVMRPCYVRHTMTSRSNKHGNLQT